MISNDYPDYNLIIYGQGSLKSSYEQLVERLHIKDRVCFPGYTNDVRNSIIDSSVFVLPSRFEGMPNVLIEAMSVGVPVVACDCTPGGPAFLTDNGKRGVLVRVNDPIAISEGIKRVLDSNEYSLQLSKTEIDIKKILDKEKIDNKWIEVFSDIILRG